MRTVKKRSMPFIDREGYLRYIDSAEARFKRGFRGERGLPDALEMIHVG